MIGLKSEENPTVTWYMHLLGNELQYIVLNSENVEDIVRKGEPTFRCCATPLLILVVVVVVGNFRTACSNEDYCSPILCLGAKQRTLSRLQSLFTICPGAREGLGCMHIFCFREYPGCWLFSLM